LSINILPNQHNVDRDCGISHHVRGNKLRLEGIPHIQAISAKLPLDHVTLATTCPITKCFLPTKKYFNPMRKFMEKKKNEELDPKIKFIS